MLSAVLLLSAYARADLTIEITQGVDNPTVIAIVPFGWSGTRGCAAEPEAVRGPRGLHYSRRSRRQAARAAPQGQWPAVGTNHTHLHAPALALAAVVLAVIFFFKKYF